MPSTSRIIATALLGWVLAVGWPILLTATLGYVGFAVPVLLAAWAAAWFGDEVADLFRGVPDGLIRGVGLGALAVAALVAAAARWQWFH